MSRELHKATFAAGCFWGVEAAFRRVPGVVSTVVGYTGGKTQDPTYEEVSTGRTGHAESVQVVYDASRVTYDDLLNRFWELHNPTERDRQGPDIGPQYRSAIFYHNAEQKAAAESSRKRLEESGRYKNQIVTEIVPATAFFRAEEYHQQYLEKRERGECTAL
jgi:peptide-methionine (S)-S-oxide reductase